MIQQSQALVLKEQQSQALMSPAHMNAAQEKAAMFAAQMNAKAQAAKEAAAEEHFQVGPRRLTFRSSARFSMKGGLKRLLGNPVRDCKEMCMRDVKGKHTRVHFQGDVWQKSLS